MALLLSRACVVNVPILGQAASLYGAKIHHCVVTYSMQLFFATADPLGTELVIPNCCEDKEVIPQKSYYGGQEGEGLYTWYRSKRKLLGSDLVNLSASCEDVLVIGQTLTYKPSLEDVGAYLGLYWVPTRADGKQGEPLIAISEHPVTAASPVVSNVRITKLSSSIYSGEGKYYGGYEGLSLFSWYRETNEGAIVLINEANSNTYEVADADYNCRLLFGLIWSGPNRQEPTVLIGAVDLLAMELNGEKKFNVSNIGMMSVINYTPVRSDSVVGELILSEPTDIILPELPEMEMLALTGKAIEGEILTAVEVIPKNDVQKHVWDKYKKDVQYQWLSSSSEEQQLFELLPLQRSCSYKVRLEDIGRYLRCECIVTDVFGRSSEPASAVTPSVLPGMPKVDKLEIEGRGFHTNLYAVRGIYSGGKEGKSRIQWLRSMVGSPDLISIPGEEGRMYEANVDDVGYRLVAIYTPVREDGVEGQPVSASTEPIAVVVAEPDVHKEVKQKLDLGSVKFEGPGVGTLERRILEVNRKRVKVVKPGSKTSFPATEIRGNYAPPFHVELFRNDQHRLKIVVDSENEVDLMVQTRHMRDVIVLVIRGLAQRFNSTSLNSLLKIETDGICELEVLGRHLLFRNDANLVPDEKNSPLNSKIEAPSIASAGDYQGKGSNQ
ncbi:Microtubule-associated protein air9 [Asimina triloba]